MQTRNSSDLQKIQYGVMIYVNDMRRMQLFIEEMVSYNRTSAPKICIYMKNSVIVYCYFNSAHT
jgi:hypothetical protein